MSVYRCFVQVACAALLTQYVLGSQVETNSLSTLQMLQPGQPAEVNLAAGDYVLPKEGLLLKNLEGVTINAEGVRLLASNPVGSALIIRNCKNLTIRGLTVDYNPLPFTQGTITAVDREALTADIAIHDGYPDLTEDYLVRRAHLFEKDRHLWKAGAPDYYLSKNERLDARHCRLHFQKGETAFHYVEVGDRIVMNIRKAAAIQVRDNSEGLHLEDCTIHAGPGLGLLVRFAKDGGTYERLRVLPGPLPEGATEPRLLSTCADAVNIAYTRKGPIISECEFAYMGDDSVNLHGATLPVLAWEDEKTCLSMRPFGDDPFEDLLQEGDVVRFLQEPDFSLIRTSEIESIERANEPFEKWESKMREIWPSYRKSKNATFYRIRFKDAISDVPAGISFCEFHASSASGFVIKDSYFHDHRARGLRLMSNDGLIENNRFERLKGAAISAGPEFAYWKEAGWVHDLTIRGNTITDVGLGAHQLYEESYTLGAISLFTHVLPMGMASRYYQGNDNILIEDNVIDGCSMDGISIVASKNVVIRNNEISNVNLIDAGDAGRDYGLKAGQAISIIQSEALIENNTIHVAPPKFESKAIVPDVDTASNVSQEMLTLSTSVMVGNPKVDGSHLVNAELEGANGFRFYWIENEGRRALGQQFKVSKKTKISQLALKINSATRNLDTNSLFSLTFARTKNGSAQPGEILASYVGLIPDEDEKLDSRTWLYLTFAELELKPGDYCFYVNFNAAGQAGRSLVLSVGAKNDTYEGGRGIFANDGPLGTWEYSRPLHFVLSDSANLQPAVPEQAAVSRRILNVDSNGGGDYTSLADACRDVQPGDVIRIEPGSGPYREPLFIKRSGRKDAPIVVEGSGETVTGFDPLEGFRKEGDHYVCDIAQEFPFVLVFKGERLLQDALTGQFTKYARLSEDNKSLELLPGVSPDGWEISTRYFVVRIENASHQVFRNLKATGALNDGFNLHGKGQGLVFENIEAFQNLDEGFSAHDQMQCEISDGVFYGNDNGVGNVADSEMSATRLKIYDNLGYGLWLSNCRAVLSDIQAWDNGISQIRFSGNVNVEVDGVVAYDVPWKARQWVSYKESAKASSLAAVAMDRKVQLVGEQPVLRSRESL
ncbi:right-handed parallel beta-helix repeat-containing protein [Cerasicoccus arenae]|uniref:Right handed beta helix domain-containing protein n=1 Tax=Cerasicoccus arenae TaxID=424488 RepID=A0A8J3DEL1_9BACT|nr:right-handed parallel beta-helix repeat-containing protein [Cerasicoccus arenae]MBK1858383.1 right-handed parallel beta-helix repeat-containing protein [Cerasicoccus arenae]GHC09929.1 hypothetical protein GCM10007047_29120 [Cerasicoccus arenae]